MTFSVMQSYPYMVNIVEYMYLLCSIARTTRCHIILISNRKEMKEMTHFKKMKMNKNYHTHLSLTPSLLCRQLFAMKYHKVI